MNVHDAVKSLENGETLCIANEYVFDFMRELEKHVSNINLTFKVNNRRKGVTDIILSNHQTNKP